MSQFDDNPLFTIHNLCFHGAKATKISIFWYPNSPLKLPSSDADAAADADAATDADAAADTEDADAHAEADDSPVDLR